VRLQLEEAACGAAEDFNVIKARETILDVGFELGCDFCLVHVTRCSLVISSGVRIQTALPEGEGEKKCQ
jgi:hypothetical protein